MIKEAVDRRTYRLTFEHIWTNGNHHHYTPEEIRPSILSVLYAPSYRTRYAEFLRIDFPRVPFPELANDFEKLSNGWALVQAHLLRELPRKKLADYHGNGDNTVEATRAVLTSGRGDSDQQEPIL